MERLNERRLKPGGHGLRDGLLRLGLPRVGLLAVLACSLGWSASARAEDKPNATKSRVVTISEVTIVGRIQKPIAAVDVSRIQPKLTLAKLHQPFLQRVEAAIYDVPF